MFQPCSLILIQNCGLLHPDPYQSRIHTEVQIIKCTRTAPTDNPRTPQPTHRHRHQPAGEAIADMQSTKEMTKCATSGTPKGTKKGSTHPPPFPTLIRYKYITSDECKTNNRLKQNRIQGESQAPKIRRPKSHVTVKPL